MQVDRASGERSRPLRRSAEGRLVAGVAAGFADYFDVDVAMVRVVLVALAVIGGLAVPFYLAAWILVPEAGRDESVLDLLLSHRRAEDVAAS